jgi:hypothetical protein
MTVLDIQVHYPSDVGGDFSSKLEVVSSDLSPLSDYIKDLARKPALKDRLVYLTFVCSKIYKQIHLEHVPNLHSYALYTVNHEGHSVEGSDIVNLVCDDYGTLYQEDISIMGRDKSISFSYHEDTIDTKLIDLQSNFNLGVVEQLNVEVTPVREMKLLPSDRRLERIEVKQLTGKVIPIDIPLLSTVGDLKAAIRDKEGIPVDLQRLVCGGKMLEYEDMTLWDYNIGAGASVHCILNLRGGMFHVTSGRMGFNPTRPFAVKRFTVKLSNLKNDVLAVIPGVEGSAHSGADLMELINPFIKKHVATCKKM